MSLNKYWEDRYRAEEKAREMADKSTAQQLNGIYEQNRNNIQKEIESFWQRYADSESVTKLEAKQRADRLDMAVVEFRAKQLVDRANRLRERGQQVTSRDFTQVENSLMKLYNLKMKTSRLEVLQANIQLHQYDLALNEFEIIDKHLTESIRRENLFSAGVLGNTLGSFTASKVSADSLVFANFKGANWSSKLWTRQNELREVVRKGVADGVLRGQGTAPLINKLKKEFDVSYSYARRLAVTESARVYSEAQKANYEANGVDEFGIMTEAKACPICQPFGGKIYKVSELVPALNAPPFHPNCRCTTVPVSRKGAKNHVDNDREPAERIKGASKTISDILFEERLPKAAEEKVLNHFDFFNNSRIVLRPERLKHILERHSDIGEDVEEVVHQVIKDPQIILMDHKNDNSILILGKSLEDNVNVVVRLSNTDFDNSIITAMRVSDKTLKRLFKKNKKIYDKNE